MGDFTAVTFPQELDFRQEVSEIMCRGIIYRAVRAHQGITSPRTRLVVFVG